MGRDSYRGSGGREAGKWGGGGGGAANAMAVGVGNMVFQEAASAGLEET